MSSAGGEAATKHVKRHRAVVENGCARSGPGTAPEVEPAASHVLPSVLPQSAKRQNMCSNCFTKGHISKFCKELKRVKQKNATSVTALQVSQRVRAFAAPVSPSAPSSAAAALALPPS